MGSYKGLKTSLKIKRPKTTKCLSSLAKPTRILKTKTIIAKLAKYNTPNVKTWSLQFHSEGQTLNNNDQSLIESIKKSYKYSRRKSKLKRIKGEENPIKRKKFYLKYCLEWHSRKKLQVFPKRSLNDNWWHFNLSNLLLT